MKYIHIQLVRIFKIKSTISKFLFLFLLFCNIQNYTKADNYYWVGGSGNWSDISHWVTTSGGQTNHLKVPSAFDDIFFDSNSFNASGQSVIVNADNYSCRNIDWTGVTNIPEFTNTNGYKFAIYGSLILNSDMNFNYNGQIDFESTNLGNTILMNGQQFHGNVFFYGIGGSWTFLDTFNAGSSTIYMCNGTLNTNNHTINCGQFSTYYSTVKTLNLGSSIVNTISGISLNATGLTLIPGSSVINVSSINGNVALSGSIILNNVNFTNISGTSTLQTNSGVPSFNNVTFNNNAFISGNNSFNNLTFKGDNNWLKEGNTQTIINYLNANGTCANAKNIFSTSDTVQSNILKINGSINLDYIFLKSIKVSGGGIFNATNSCDIGNNSGWNISSPVSHNLFWVGGTGNWNDPNHWSYTSGGSGGACTPSPFDNVSFDANSFLIANQSVTINCLNAFCKNMIWTGVINSPSLSGSSSNCLYIYGSLKFDQNMSMDFSGYTYFKASTINNSILSSSKIFKNHVIFDRSNGGWILSDQFNANGYTIYLVNGTLNLNNQNVTCAAFYSDYSNVRQLYLTTSIINVTSNNSRAWTLNKSNLFFSSGSSIINFTTSFGGMYNTGNDSLKYNNVTFQQNTGNASLVSSSVVGKFNNVIINSDGLISGNNVYSNLTLAKNFYQLGSGNTQTIYNNLTINGYCNSNLYLYTTTNGTQAYIKKYSGNITLDFVILKDIQVIGSGVFTANNSVDLGNNSGWIMNTHIPSNLYWVGGTGNWNDPLHWSYTSGGVSGACIPTPIDNVLFDGNSYSCIGQYTNVNQSIAFCNNITWSNVNYNPQFKTSLNGILKIFGSLAFCSGMTNNYSGPITFESTTSGKTILMAGNKFLNDIYFIGIKGAWILQDKLSCEQNVFVNNGSLLTNNKDITVSTFNSLCNSYRTIDFGYSNINIVSNSSYAWSINANNLNLNLKNSILKFLSANGGMSNISSDTIKFNKVWFVDSSGVSNILNNGSNSKFKNVFFRSDGGIYGSNAFDTLNFYPSKTYTLQSLKTQRINSMLNMSGNGCFPIALISSDIGVQSSIYKSSGIVSASYVIMKDQNAYGGAGFYAGNNSVNIANNSGWYFGTPPGFVFGLPDTAYVCYGDTLVLNTYNFIGGVKFKWQDGTASSTYKVFNEGKYWVEVTYADHCFLVDTVNVFYKFIPSVTMCSNYTICRGISVSLSANATSGTTYLWNNNMTTPTINVNPIISTTYIVNAANVCGSVFDSVSVTVNPLPIADAGNDTVICINGSANLQANGFPGSTYQWSNSLVGNNIIVAPTSTTSYIVSVTDQNSCGVAIDSMTVFIMSPITVNLGNDLSICSGSDATLNAVTFPGSTYHWNTNQSTSNIYVTPLVTSNYTVTVTDSLSCSHATDEISVNVLFSPTVDAGNDFTICEGNSAIITANTSSNNDILWNTNDTSLIISVQPNTTTIYSITVSNVCGSTNDQVTVFVNAPIQENVSVSNTHCGQNNGELTAAEGLVYYWSTGETTPTISNLTSGIYYLTVSNGVCNKIDSFEVVNTAGPKADFDIENNNIYSNFGEVKFIDQSSGEIANYKWDFGDGYSVENNQNPVHYYNNKGEFYTKLKINDKFNCVDSIIKKIEVTIPNVLTIPNAFTPNGDGLNDGFGPIWLRDEEIVKYQMLIYDRLGKIVFETNDKNELWDGSEASTHKLLPEGVYTWRIQYEQMIDNNILANNKAGVITLIEERK